MSTNNNVAQISTGDALPQYPSDKAPFYVSLFSERRPIRLAKTGAGATPPITIPALLQKAVEKHADKPAFFAEYPHAEPALPSAQEEKKKAFQSLPLEEWRKWTYAEVWRDSCLAAKGMISLGFQPEQTVSILGFNSPFYAFAAYGSMIAGGVQNGIYFTDTADQIEYKCKLSKTTIVCVDTKANLQKLIQVSKNYDDLKAIVVWKEIDCVQEAQKNNPQVEIISFEELLSLGEDLENGDEKLKERMDQLRPEECCSIIFTSGTTGKPKACMISHDNLFYLTLQMESMFPKELFEKTVRLVSFLPLSYIAALFIDLLGYVAIAANTEVHGEVYFVRSYDLKFGSLLNRLQTVRPTFFFGVPRVWEKFMEAFKAQAAKAPDGLMKTLLALAQSKMYEGKMNEQLGKNGQRPWGHFLSKLLMSKVLARLGFDQLVVGGSGASAMKFETIKFWAGFGIGIKELYGMSETTACTAANTNSAFLYGTVGHALEGMEVKVFKVDPEDFNSKEEVKKAPDDIFNGKDIIPEEFQGELCFRGRHIMLGYLANESFGEEHVNEIRKKNEASMDKEGWLHSGDKACIGENNMIKITGRFKELIIGAGGENIAPVPIEDDLKKRCAAISNVVMIGNDRKYNVALISLHCEGASGDRPGNNVLTGEALDFAGSSAKTLQEAEKDEKFVKELEKCLKETNSNGHVVMNNSFKIQKIALLPQDLSVEGGELTATLKLKRKTVEEKYKDLIDKLYSSQGVFIPTLDNQ